MRIALVSLDQKWEDKAFNKDRCTYFSKRVEQEFDGVDLIIYPEMTLTGFSVKNPSLAECTESSPTMKFFQGLAKSTHVSHAAGMIAKRESGRHYNRCFFIDKSGVVRGTYDKMHTFSFAGESDSFDRGDSLCSVYVEGVRFGLSICYDLRFSNLYASYRDTCDVVLNIANWPAARKSHWLALLKARAIENQNFMIGVNRVGIDRMGSIYKGASNIFDPLGERRRPFYEEKELSVYDLDLSLVRQTRGKFPFIKDRRQIL
ncbi:amidohydrolase [Pseudomonadales bacterium]|nr:amidohydrolase [Pseudomonadales bacterium]